MKRLDICYKLLYPFISEEGHKTLSNLEKKKPEKYELLIEMREELREIHYALLKVNSFIDTLKADKKLYEIKIENKKRENKDFQIEQAILYHINAQLSLLEGIDK